MPSSFEKKCQLSSTCSRGMCCGRVTRLQIEPNLDVTESPRDSATHPSARVNSGINSAPLARPDESGCAPVACFPTQAITNPRIANFRPSHTFNLTCCSYCRHLFFSVPAKTKSLRQPLSKKYGFSTIYTPEGEILNTAHSLYGTTIVYADL